MGMIMGSIHDPWARHDDADERVLRDTLGRRLRECRKQRRMTMVMLGRVAQCSQSLLSKIENGVIMPSIPMLHRLASALDVKPSALLGEEIRSAAEDDGRPDHGERGV